MKLNLSPATKNTLYHFLRLTAYGAASALLTFGIIPFLSTYLPSLHFANAQIQAVVLLAIPVVLGTLVNFKLELNAQLAAEEQAKNAPPFTINYNCDAISSALRLGIITPNEAAKIQGKPLVDGGDVPLINPPTTPKAVD